MVSSRYPENINQNIQLGFSLTLCITLPMMTSSNGNIFRVTGPLCGEFTGPGEFPAQRLVTRSFDVFFDLRLNKRLSKQPWGWWFETPSWSLWRQCNEWCYHERVSIIYLTVCSGVDQRKHQRSASLAFMRGIYRWTVNSPHKGPVTRKMFSFDDVIMNLATIYISNECIKSNHLL